MALPEIVEAGKYASVYDQYGNVKALGIPLQRGILFTSDGDVKWEDGSDHGLLLDALKLVESENAAMSHLGGFTGQGALVRFGAPPTNANALVPVSVLGVIKWVQLTTGNSIPSTGSGFIYRNPVTDDNPNPTLNFMGGGGTDHKGLAYVQDNGEPKLVSNGASGMVLTMVGNEPVFASPASGTVTSGGVATTGLAGLVGASLNSHSLSVQVPSISLVNAGGDTITAAAVNVSADIESSLGIGALDTGAESANKWYYYYVTSDGAGDVGLILSENGTSPNLSGTTHTYWGFAGVVRNNSAGDFVSFIQKGRAFYTNAVLWGDALSSTTSFNAVASGTNLNTIIPPICKTCGGVAGGSSAEAAARNLYLASTSGGIAYQSVTATTSGPAVVDSFRFDVGSFHNLPIADPSSPSIYWKTSSASSKRRIVITSYTI